MQTASSYAERRPLTATDDALDDDCVWEDHEDDYDAYLDRPFRATKKGTGLHSKSTSLQHAKKKPAPTGERPGALAVGGKFGVLHDSISLVLQDMVTKKVLGDVRQRIHTGQHATIYYATGHGERRGYVVKIFVNAKRKRLKLRAQREFQLLSRAFESGVRVPEPMLCQEHVIVSRFVSASKHEKLKPAPPLCDVRDFSLFQLQQCYSSVLGTIRRLYHELRLVHGNISERSVIRNKLWDCYLTDFSHAVDRDHVDHLALLKKDLASVQAFFSSRGLPEATKSVVGLVPDDVAMALITTEDLFHGFDEYDKCRVYTAVYSAPA